MMMRRCWKDRGIASWRRFQWKTENPVYVKWQSEEAEIEGMICPIRRICVHGASLWTVAVADLRYSALWELLTLVPRIDWFVSAGFLLGVSALLLWHRYMAAEEGRLPYSIPEHVVMWSKAMRRWTGIYVSEGRNRVNDFSDSDKWR